MAYCVVKSDAKNTWGLGRERTAAAPAPKSRASNFRFACYIFATSLLAWHRLRHTSLSCRRFLFLLTCGRKEYNSPKNAFLRRSRHALMCSQFIRENEKSTHFCSKLRAKNGLFFCFVSLLLFVYQSLDRLYSVKFPAFCLRFVFLPFAPCACFLLFPRVQFSLFPALFT